MDNQNEATPPPDHHRQFDEPVVTSDEINTMDAPRQVKRLTPSSNNQLRHGLSVYLKILLGVVAAIMLGGVGYGVYIVSSVISGTSQYCSQKTNSADQQVQLQTNELREALHGAMLFGAEPRITTSTDNDCLDGDGTGSVEADYLAHDTDLTQAERGVMEVLGGTALPLTLNGKWGMNGSFDGGEGWFVHYLVTRATTGSGKSYDVQFQLADAYTCTEAAGCTDGSDVVQRYNLQNTPIYEVHIEVAN